MGKHSLLVAGHATSISLEHAFWTRLCLLATRRGQSIAALVAGIDAGRGDANLSSAIRVYLLEAAADAGASVAARCGSDSLEGYAGTGVATRQAD